MEEQREVGGANGELSQEEAGLTEKTHNNFKGTCAHTHTHTHTHTPSHILAFLHFTRDL